MPPELWQRVKPIVFEALELDPGDWAGYLRRTCNGDAELLGEVQSLLEVSWSIGDFIEEPALEMLRRDFVRLES